MLNFNKESFINHRKIKLNRLLANKTSNENINLDEKIIILPEKIIVLPEKTIVLNKNEINKNIITSNLSNSVGFYSMFFFTLNHYLYAKKYNLILQINSDQWLFKSYNGWSDYFESNTEYNNNKNIKKYNHGDVLEEFPIIDYKNSIGEIYIYNDKTKHAINNIKKKYNLVDYKYDSIFIRRGDKLSIESKYYSSEDYINLLLKINPDCTIIFLQTDDYNSYIDLKKYINNKNLNINLITLCPENSFGVIVNNSEKNKLINTKSNFSNNHSYIKKNIDKFKNTKPVSEMNSSEIYQHTLDLIIGVEFLIKSNICICDFQSNVSRFVKLAHNNHNNVYDIISPNQKIDYSKKICPAYSF